MTDQSRTDAYFTALATADGSGAAALFSENGVIDDLRGGHHPGREEIERFIDNRPDLTVEILSPAHQDGPRITVYGQIRYASGEEKYVRWLFTEGTGGFDHLCNSDVERLPAERLRADTRV